MELGKKIAYFRKKANLTQEDLAEKMGVSRQAVYKWEHNLSTPEIQKLEKLITLFNITYNDLFKEEKV